MLWHEALSGRKAEDIMSSFYGFLKMYRFKESVTFWMDNCAAQNKNWTFYTSCVTVLNVMNDWNLKEIQVKYLLKGHTHMLADGIHGNSS